MAIELYFQDLRLTCVFRRTIAVKAARTADGKRQLRLESRFLAMLEHKNIIRAQGLSTGQAANKAGFKAHSTSKW